MWGKGGMNKQKGEPEAKLGKGETPEPPRIPSDLEAAFYEIITKTLETQLQRDKQ